MRHMLNNIWLLDSSDVFYVGIIVGFFNGMEWNANLSDVVEWFGLNNSV